MTENRWIAWVRRLREGRRRRAPRSAALTMTWLRQRRPAVVHMMSVTRRFARNTVVRMFARFHIDASRHSTPSVVETKHIPYMVPRFRQAAAVPGRTSSMRHIYFLAGGAARTSEARVARDASAPTLRLSEGRPDPGTQRLSRRLGSVPVRPQTRRSAALFEAPAVRLRRVVRRQEQMPSDRPSLVVRAPAPAAARQPMDVQPNMPFDPRERHEQSQWTAPAPPSVEVLTDEVIRQIDRRVIAQRERLGRV